VLVADIELALAKVDLDIAERYSLLAGDLHARFFPVIREEYEQCVAIVLSLSKQQKLLESKDALRRAIRLRNPYVDPMSFLQVDFLRRWRAGGRKDDEVLQALLASINGIAHGMQNTA
jgi:phosphoenolpyruvate carboxylase